MTKVKILAVSDASKVGKNVGAGSPAYCTDPAYIGRTGYSEGGLITLTGEWVYVQVRIDDNGTWLFKSEQIEEVAE